MLTRFFIISQTLTSFYCSPVVGEIFKIDDSGAFGNNSGPIKAGSGGLNTTWDFSQYDVRGVIRSHTMTAVTFTNGSSTFTNANIVRDKGNGNLDYYDISDHGQIDWGTVVSNTVCYSDSRVILPYPFSYGNSVSDNYGIPGSFVGRTTFTADGTGTLLLFQNTYTNTIRVHYQNTLSIIYSAPSKTVTTIENVYSWFKPGIHAPVFSAISTTVSGNPNPWDRYETLNEAVDHTDLSSSAFEDQFEIFPNPAFNVLNVTAPFDKVSRTEIVNLQGQVVKKVPPKTGGIFGIEITDLQPGLYFLRISTNEGNWAVKNFVVAH